jgi:hypothetical protein
MKPLVATIHSITMVGALVWLTGCASPPIALAPVGPGPFVSGARVASKGDLEVYTETQEYDEDDLAYFPHTDYEIYTSNGKHLRHVWNHQNHEDESPAIVTLPPGEYEVRAWADSCGLVSVPVVIKPNETTRLILQPGWQPDGAVAKSDLVQMPNGYFVGWRASPDDSSKGRL